MTKFLRALRESTAEIFYFRCADYLLAPVVWAAHRRGRKVVFCAASDPNLDPAKLKLPRVHKAMFFWGLRRCDAVVVQNGAQLGLLEQHFGRKGHLIHNGSVSTSDSACDPKNILWVGRQAPVKRPDSLLKLARSVHDHPFVMIGGAVGVCDQAYYEQVKRDAEPISNLDVKGPMELSRVESEFDQAKVFVNTSVHEGFPNTFLQAWSRGIPVFSFVDPDGLIEKHGLGYVASDVDDMAQMLKRHLAGEACFSSEQIRQVFEDLFTIETAVDRYEVLFDKVTGATSGGIPSHAPLGIKSASTV
jgi:glycosyltransferase involved in cell wall biosynthesis